MFAKNVLGLIFSNAYDEVLPQLTALRTMGSVPFAGRYRLIDFPLSNMVNAGVTQVGVITNSNYRSLMDHIGNGKPWDLSRKNEGLTILPPFSLPSTGRYAGNAEALYGSIDFISDSSKEYVLVTDCNFISSIDYDELVKFNIAKDADITLAYCEAAPEDVADATEFTVDGDGKVTESKYIDCYSGKCNFSLKTMVIRKTLLERLLHEANSKRIANIEQIIIDNVKHLKIFGYKVEGYVKVISSINSYYEASMDLLKPEIRKAIFDKERPVYTKTGDRIPAFYGIAAKATDSLIADGCKIEGEVENSILFRGVTVAKGAKVKNSIIMQDTMISEGASVECVICDKDVVIKPNKKLCGDKNYPVCVGKGIVI